MIIHAEKPICGYWCETCRLQFQAPDCSHWEEEPSHQMVPVMPVTAVHALRCISHRTVLPYNREASGGECAACAVESEKRAGPPRADGQCEDCSENKWVTFEAKLTVCAECGCAVSWEKRPGPPVEAGPKRVHVAQEHDNAWCPGHAVATSECPAPVEAAPAGMEESR